MNAHIPSGRWKIGFLLSLVTAIMWGVLPIALKLALAEMDAVTISWYRFVIAAGLVGAISAHRKRLPPIRRLTQSGWVLLIIVVTGLCGNYLLYLVGLDFITPGTAQIVIQLAPMLFLLGALAFYKERFSTLQWTGFVIFIAGLLFFFNDRLFNVLSGHSKDSLGILFIVLAAVTWAAYALAQKQLLKFMSSNQALTCVYISAAFLFLPGAHPAQILNISLLTLSLLIFASLNTVVAYGCFAEALSHWEASRVSAVIALAPLFTFVVMMFLQKFLPQLGLREPLDALTIIGASAVVTGSMLAALGGRSAKAIPMAAIDVAAPSEHIKNSSN